MYITHTQPITAATQAERLIVAGNTQRISTPTTPAVTFSNFKEALIHFHVPNCI